MGHVGDQGYGVSDETSLGGNMGRVVEGRQAKAAVVASQEMGFWDAGDGAVS